MRALISKHHKHPVIAIFFVWPFFGVLFFHAWPAGSQVPFKDVRIEPAFYRLLLHEPHFMKEGGARLIFNDNGKPVLVGIGTIVPDDRNPETLNKAIRIGEIRARTAVLGLRDGIRVSITKEAMDGPVQDKVALSSFFQVTDARVQGMIEQLPVIGTWWSGNGETLYVAVGAIQESPGYICGEPGNQTTRGLNDHLHNLQGKEPFISILRACPLFSINCGARGFLMDSTRRILLSIGSAPLGHARAKARRVAQLKALRSLMGIQQGIYLSSVEYLAEKEVLRLSEEGHRYMLLSEFLSVQQEQVSGVVKSLPVVATWEDPEGQFLFVAIGKVVSEGFQ